MVDVDKILSDIQESFGEGSVMRMGAEPARVEVIPSGSLSLDKSLGVGGFPLSRISEIYGPEGSGKTTLALHAIASAQERDGLAAMIDAEHALDPAYAQRLGVKIEDLLLSQPDHGEQALEIALRLLSIATVIVIDSVAALIPKQELEGEIEDEGIGLQARMMSKAMRKFAGAVGKSKCCVIFLNQTRSAIGQRYDVTSGGKALKFYASVRVKLSKKGFIKDDTTIIGSVIEANVVKNKVAPPFRQAEFRILFEKGIDYLRDLVEHAVVNDLVERTKEGSHFFAMKEAKPQGIGQLVDYLAGHPDEKAALIDKIQGI